MDIIGVCGRKRHGKDTVGSFLGTEYGYQRIAFADPVKKIAMDIYGLSYDQCFGDLKEVVDERWGKSPRVIMQHIGTEMGRGIHPDTWVHYAFTTIERVRAGEPVDIFDESARGFVRKTLAPDTRWVITDVRFKNEAETVVRAGGQVWKVFRPGLPLDPHVSESEVDLIKPTLTLPNDGTLEDLHDRVREAMGYMPTGGVAA